MLDHVKLRRPLLGDDLVGDLLQLRVELLEQVFKQQGEQLGLEEDAGWERETNSVNTEHSELGVNERAELHPPRSM